MDDYLNKLNALIAEHVFGWVEVDYVVGGYGDGRNNTKEGPWYEWRGRAKGMDISEQIPSFSTQVDLAWQVVEKMRAEMWNVTVYVQNTQGCTMHKHHESYYLKADSVPLAICLAALTSLKIELPVQVVE